MYGGPHTVFDDLHFGVIPDPTTGLLLVLGVPVLLKRRRQWKRVNLRATVSVTVLVVMGLTTGASGPDISGKVTGFATPFDPEYLPDTPTNPPQVVDLEGCTSGWTALRLR